MACARTPSRWFFRKKSLTKGNIREKSPGASAPSHEIPVSPQDTLAVLPKLSCDGSAHHGRIKHLSCLRQDRAAGVKVALTGLGADEMFAGYSNFRACRNGIVFTPPWATAKACAWALSASLTALVERAIAAGKLADLAARKDSVILRTFSCGLCLVRRSVTRCSRRRIARLAAIP